MITEAFTGTDGDPIPNFAALSGTFVIKNNAGRKSASIGTLQFTRHDTALATSDNYAQLVTKGAAGSNTIAQSPLARMSASAATAYGCYNYANTFTLSKWVAGSQTDLASTSLTLVDDDTYKTEASGTAIKAYVNGVQKHSVTDSGVASGARVGIMCYDVGNGSETFDTFQADDLGGGGGNRRRRVLTCAGS